MDQFFISDKIYNIYLLLMFMYNKQIFLDICLLFIRLVLLAKKKIVDVCNREMSIEY